MSCQREPTNSTNGRLDLSQEYGRMASRDIAVAIILLSQIALGIPGNSVLLGSFIFADFTGIRARPTDFIIKHMAWANLMVLLFKGIPQTMAALGWSYFLDDIGCKLIFYLHRVARGVCLGSTSLLSMYQVIIINPSNSRCTQLKIIAPKMVRSSLGLCWILQLMVNSLIPMRVTAMWNKRNLSRFRDLVYCAVVEPHNVTVTLHLVLFASIDVICLGFMIWASASMILLLLEHKQRVRHIHKDKFLRSSPETRATQIILMLVSSFVLFYITSVILTMCFSILDTTSRWLAYASAVMDSCFPVFCPFLIIRHCTTAFRFCCPCSARQRSVLV